LLDARGHVRLADFGSCIYVDEKTGVTSSVSVGTPDYISPEVLQSNEGKGSYGKECDFWSLGITLYELLVGDPPFYAESLAETYHQIMNHQKFFNVPSDVTVTQPAMSLMKQLVCDRKDRLKSAAEIKKHPFFSGINWEKLHERTFLQSL
jgi:serine/threonine protein kinase